MTEQTTNRGAAEERAGVPYTPEEDNKPASPSSVPGGEPPLAQGAAEEASDAPETD